MFGILNDTRGSKRGYCLCYSCAFLQHTKTEMSFCGKTEKGARVDRSATSKAPNLYFTRVPNDVTV